MSDIGYYTLPVIPSMKGITGELQSQLDKAFKGAGESAGKIMGQSAAETFAKDPGLSKAIATGPAALDAITKSTDKQTASVTKLRTEEKKLSDVRGTAVVAAEQKVIEHRQKAIDQLKNHTYANDEFMKSVIRAGEEQVKQANAAQKAADQVKTSSGGGSFGDQLKRDAGKALGGDTGGAVSDLGDQLGKAIGTKIGGTLRDTVKDITGMSVDTMADKVKGAGEAIGVDVGAAVTKAMSGDKTGAFKDVGEQLGAKIGTTISGQVKELTGIDLGSQPGSLIQQFAPGAAGAVADWAGGGGVGDVLDWFKGGGARDALTSARGALGSVRAGGLGGVRDALGGVDPKSLLGGINNVTGGGLQPILDAHSGAMDVMEGLLGGTAAEKFLPAIADTALPIVAGGFFGQKLGRGLQGLDSDRVEAGYDDTGTATNPIERTVESIPVVGDFLGPSQEIRTANQRRRDATPGSTESFYRSIFGDDRSGIGSGTGGGGGGGGPVSTEDMQVDASVATISAGSVTVGGSISLPGLSVGGGGGGGGGGRSAPIVGSASSSGAESSLYGGDTGGSYFAKGGPIGTDTIPLWGSPGEWMIQASSAAKYGPTMMSAINAGHFAGGGPIDGTRGADPHKGPKGSASDPIYTMPSPGYTQAIAGQAPPRSGTSGGGGSAGLPGGGAGGDAFNAAGGIQGLMGIGQQAASDMIPGFGNIGSDPLAQAGMNMMQAMLGMAMQPGGLKGALTSDAAGKRTFGAMFGGSGDDAGGGGFGMIPQVAGMPHPDDMVASPSDAAFGDVLSNRIGGGETPHVDNSTNLTVNGFSAQEVGNQVYRNLGSSGMPNNTPRMNTKMPAGG